MPKAKQRILITGASRGIGLEFVRQYLDRGDYLFACCRHPDDCDALNTLHEKHRDQLHLIELDLANESSIKDCYESVFTATQSIDILINNAGIMPGPEPLDTLDQKGLARIFEVNTIGPLLLFQKFRHLLSNSDQPRVINISSHLGSIKTRIFGGYYGYGGSKVALNMMTRSLSLDLKNEPIITISLNPGWVRTDLGGPEAPLSVGESVSAMTKFIDRLKKRHNGGFYSRTGKAIPW